MSISNGGPDGLRVGVGGVLPQLGADTDAVLREAGFADQDPAALVEQGVIRSPVHSPTTQERTPWSSESPAAP